MFDGERVLFAHSGNENGTFDSICHRCLQTIARMAHKSDLQYAEDNHVCDPSIVERYRWLSMAIFDYRVQSKGHASSNIRQVQRLSPL
jgi:hypothetical protein